MQTWVQRVTCGPPMASKSEGPAQRIHPIAASGLWQAGQPWPQPPQSHWQQLHASLMRSDAHFDVGAPPVWIHP